MDSYDTDGFDYAIMSQFDFAEPSTQLVIYESENVAVADIGRLSDMFE